MSKQFLKESFGLGFVLWLIGYILGILLFPFVPSSMIGWVIMPLGILIMLWVLVKKVKRDTLKEYFKLALIWTFMAIVFDYLFLVRVFKPQDGYYKLDVYLYYFFTFIIPLIFGWRRLRLNN